MGLLALLASLMLRLGARVNGPHALRLALAHLSRERRSGLFQLAGFALALMLFGLLWAVRIDLLEEFLRPFAGRCPQPVSGQCGR